jgi:hypothetical protein
MRRPDGRELSNMCALRRVDGERAGPAALGILVPPGRRTFLILRPRALAWDLVLVAEAGGVFRDMSPLEAETAALRLHRALEAWSGTGGEGHLEEVADPAGAGVWVRARVGPYALLACPRRPGEPYRPETFADRDDARAAAAQLLAVLRPPPGVEQEYYVNTRQFGH